MDSLVQQQSLEKRMEITIQSDDILAINVTSISSNLLNKTADPVTMYNNGGTQFTLVATSGGGQAGQNSGYLVDGNGFIDYPVVGKIKVAGLTIRQAKETIQSQIKDYLKDPVVEVRILNYKITVLGDVNRPGTVVAPNHKINLVEALAAAGDVLITGRKDHIMVIREQEGRREFAYLNLNSRNVFSSPYYYLRQNDIVYVEPSRVRRQENNEFFRFYLPAISSVLSTALAVYGIVQLSNK